MTRFSFYPTATLLRPIHQLREEHTAVRNLRMSDS